MTPWMMNVRKRTCVGNTIQGIKKWKPSYIITSHRVPVEQACRHKVATAKPNEGSAAVKCIFSLPMASFLKTTHPFTESHGGSEKLPYKHKNRVK